MPPRVWKWGRGVGLGSGPTLKNEEYFGTKINKETYIFKKGVFWSSPGRKSGTSKCIFLKRGVFRSSPGRKSGVFRSGPGRKMGGLSGGTYPYCPNMGAPPPPPTHSRDRLVFNCTQAIYGVCRCCCQIHLPDRLWKGKNYTKWYKNHLYIKMNRNGLLLLYFKKRTSRAVPSGKIPKASNIQCGQDLENWGLPLRL